MSHPLIRLVLPLLLTLLLSVPAGAASLQDLIAPKEVDEKERTETIERIQDVQEKLKLLQEKLGALERRKAAKQAEERAATLGAALPAEPVQINWQGVDETTVDPGEYGLYTYLLFQGDLTDTAAAGALEDFILTLETLPMHDIPPALANRFLVPVEKPQSSVSLGRQLFDFTLNAAFLRRLGLTETLAAGPVLVSTNRPVDPYGVGERPAFLATAFGRQSPQRIQALARAWHTHEKSAVTSGETALADLFWRVTDGAGPVRVERSGGRMTVTLAP